MLRFATSPFMWYAIYATIFAALVVVMTGCRMHDIGGL
jgi:hypothetical protein